MRLTRRARAEDFYGGKLKREDLEDLCGEECDNEYDQILRFHDCEVVARGWRVYRLEQRVVHDAARVCGSIDALFYDPEEPPGTIHMVDWKRSGEIRVVPFDAPRGTACFDVHHDAARRRDTVRLKTFMGKRGKPPFNVLPDCNWGHYAVQQNVYRAIIEQHTSLRIASTNLAVFHPAHDSYELYPMPDVQAQTYKVLADRAALFHC